MLERSCGTIPYTIKDKTIYYLLINTKDGRHCGFPKGHTEPGESEIETAFRETLEETSIEPIIDREFRYEISYQMNNGNKKTVVYFLADFGKQLPKRNNNFEDFHYLILPFEKAYQELTFENTKEMLKIADNYLNGTLNQQPSPTGEG